MKFIELVNEIEENIQKNILPIYNQQGILAKLATIKGLTSQKEIARHALMKFCIELIMVIKQLLDVRENATQNQIIQSLNQTKLKIQLVATLPAQITNVKMDQYIHFAEIKSNYYQTYLQNNANLTKITALTEFLQKAMHPIINTRFNYKPPLLNRGPALGSPLEELNLLKKDKENVFTALAQVENALKVFDSKLMELYGCSTSQVYFTIPLIFITTSQRVASLSGLLQNTSAAFKGIFANREVIFVMDSRNDATGIRLTTLMNYIYALRFIKRFTLKIEASEEVLLPEVAREKQFILNEFNTNIKEALHNLPDLTGELRVGEALKTDSSIVELTLTKKSESSTTNETTEVSAKGGNITSAEPPPIEVIAIGKNIQKSELPKINSLKYSVITDDKVLLLEAQIAYRTIEIRMLLANALERFQNTPKHLIIPPEILLKSELDHYINSITRDKSLLDKEFDKFNDDAAFKNNPFSFQTNTEFLAIRHLIEEISATLPAIEREMTEVESDKLENLSAIKPKIASIQKSIHNATQMLIKFKNYFPKYLYLGNTLVKDYHNIEVKLPKLETKLATIETLYAELNSQAAFHKLVEPLAEIMHLITPIKDNLNKAKEFFVTCIKPTDSNDFDNTRALIHTIQSHIHIFEDKASRAMDIITQQKLLLDNAKIAKLNKNGAGTHPNRFMTQASSSSSSSSSTTEEKHHSQRRHKR